jgi:hypothetical protein
MGHMLVLATTWQLSPYTIAKSIMSTCYMRLFPHLKDHLNPTVKLWTSNPDTIDPDIETRLGIPLLSLKRDIHECIENDDHCGPLIEKIRHSIGLEYEHILSQHLHSSNIQFLTEGMLRVLGYDKTPDILLAVPLEYNGLVINWIESKGTFGDDKTMTQSFADQFHPYLTRFGPGLVLYWHGFIDDMRGPDGSLFLDGWRQDGIMVGSEFPAPGSFRIRLDLESPIKLFNTALPVPSSSLSSSSSSSSTTVVPFPALVPESKISRFGKKNTLESTEEERWA